MFGMKLRSWMEARIVRARKKRSGKEDGAKTGRSPPLKGDPSPEPYLRREGVEETREEVTVEGAAAGAGPEEEPRPASDYSANLSSPESAYSTGYSTDGTSPGASFPPEYYINLRTGTHYFQQRRPPSPPRLPQPPSPPPPPLPRKTLPPRRPPPATLLPSHLALSPRHSTHLQPQAAPCSPSSRAKLRCSQSEVRSTEIAEVPLRNTEAMDFQTRRHRRTESAHEKSLPRPEVLTSTPLERRRKVSSHNLPPHPAAAAPSPLLPRTTLSATDSPRQRTRIRTNPWTCTKGAVQSPGPLCGLPTFAQVAAEARDPPRAEPKGPSSSSTPPRPFGASPFSIPRRIAPASPGRRLPVRGGSDSSSTSSGSSRCGTAEEDEDEDATLNEMGKFDESYVYEKETDILSDSDPTDCGDEDLADDEEGVPRREEDDDLDFIDNGSVELDARCRTPVNTGHCTYVREAARRRAAAAEEQYREGEAGGVEAARKRAAAPRPPSQRKRPSKRGGGGSRMRRERRPGGLGETGTAEEEREGAEGGSGEATSERLTEYSATEAAMVRADREADRKYRELIRQAEKILVKMQGSRSLEEDEKAAAARSAEGSGEGGGAGGGGERRGRWRTLGLECTEVSLPLSRVVVCHSGVHPPTPTAPEARLLTFRSVGVGGEPEEGRPHCPQSEPLKRKVYTCAALQRIRRTLMGEGGEGRYEEEEVERRGLMESGIDTVCSGIENAENLSPSKLSRCRGRRASSWHKSTHITVETQEKGQFGQKMVLLQRHILLQTIEGLKRSLEDQSATLHDVYNSSQTKLIET